MDDPDRQEQGMWRWQGSVDATLGEHARRLDAMNGDAKAARQAGEQLLVEIAELRTGQAVLKTKVALWSGLGGLVGAGLVSFAISLLTGAFS